LDGEGQEKDKDKDKERAIQPDNRPFSQFWSSSNSDEIHSYLGSDRHCANH
jgi:hypothetical protein